MSWVVLFSKVVIYFSNPYETKYLNFVSMFLKTSGIFSYTKHLSELFLHQTFVSELFLHQTFVSEFFGSIQTKFRINTELFRQNSDNFFSLGIQHDSKFMNLVVK